MWIIFKVLLNLLQYCFCFNFFFFDHKACGILVPWPKIEPIPPALDHQGGPWNFFVYFLNFNWRLITLQYCGGFLSYIDMNQPWLYMYSPSWTPHPPPSPSPPTGVSQCTSFECPVSCIGLGLVIYFTYGNICVSMLFSQIIPPLPSPTESKSLFFISVSLLLSRI